MITAAKHVATGMEVKGMIIARYGTLRHFCSRKGLNVQMASDALYGRRPNGKFHCAVAQEFGITTIITGGEARYDKVS
jgi:hypothetical protein